MEIETALEKIGLNRQESKIYLSSLKLGLAKASEIAKKSDINREASYYILKSLNEKGFISEIIKSGIKYYSASSPKRIIEIIEEEKQRKKETIKEILPELNSLIKTFTEHPKVEIYNGFEGLKTAASKILEQNNKTIYCYLPEKLLRYIPYFHPQFRRRRKENKIKIKVITSKSEFTLADLKKKDKQELRETRFNNGLIDNSTSAYYILEDAIVIMDANDRNQTGIYIKDEASAKLQRKIFEIIWKSSKK